MVKIEMVSHSPAWPSEFNAIANRVRDAIGDAALTIHHIGSTSVPGLAAKDIIDVQIGVANLFLPWKEKVEALGYEYREYLRDQLPIRDRGHARTIGEAFFRGARQRR